VLVIAESSLNDPRLVRSPTQGGYGLDGQWNDDFHHAVHAALTGERMGYYVDFGGTADVAKALADRFVLDGRYSTFRRRRHGAPARDIPADRFVVAIQNHDQVGNRAAGDRLTTLVSFEHAKLAAALCLLSPYVPLLFMGEEYGETNPFLYFVSHGDPAIVQAVREGRRREFEDFAWQAEVPDPQDEATFLRSKLSWSWTVPERRGMRSLYEDLIRLRHARPALHPGGATIAVSTEEQAGLVTLRYTRSGHPELLVGFNLSDQAARLENAGAGTERWRVSLTTADARYAGPGAASSRHDRELVLASWSATCYEAVA
jgi:maltooligosyltrehalose trehalohydrolase